MSDYVVVIGGANIDIEGQAAGKIRPFDSNIGHVRHSAGGVGRNIAENLSRMDIPTRLITALGKDAQGEWLRAQSERTGIDMSQVVWSDSLATSTYLSVLDKNGEMQVAINDMGVLADLTAVSLNPAHDQINKAKILCLDCNLSQPTLQHIFQTYSHLPIFVDPVSVAKIEKIRPYLTNISAIKPNLLEAEYLSGIPVLSDDDLPNVADWFHQRGVSEVYISLGHRGLFYSVAEANGRLTMPKIEAMGSATGAGDALMAGLIYGAFHEKETVEKVQYGLAAAWLTIQDLHTVSPLLTKVRLEKTAVFYF